LLPVLLLQQLLKLLGRQQACVQQLWTQLIAAWEGWQRAQQRMLMWPRLLRAGGLPRVAGGTWTSAWVMPAPAAWLASRSRLSHLLLLVLLLLLAGRAGPCAPATSTAWLSAGRWQAP
jgi:hypothetical protein